MAPSTLTPAQCASQAVSTTNVKEAMRAHRANTPQPAKRPLHPGLTQKEAGFTPADRALLADGACSDLLAGCTERGERIANRAIVVLAGLLMLAIAYGMLQDRWAEQRMVQTVEAE
jgi:hypothetical protein